MHNIYPCTLLIDSLSVVAYLFVYLSHCPDCPFTHYLDLVSLFFSLVYFYCFCFSHGTLHDLWDKDVNIKNGPKAKSFSLSVKQLSVSLCPLHKLFSFETLYSLSNPVTLVGPIYANARRHEEGERNPPPPSAENVSGIALTGDDCSWKKK